MHKDTVSGNQHLEQCFILHYICMRVNGFNCITVTAIEASRTSQCYSHCRCKFFIRLRNQSVWHQEQNKVFKSLHFIPNQCVR